MTGGFAIKHDMSDAQFQGLQSAMFRFKHENPEASNSDYMIRLQTALSRIHDGVAPIDMINGYKEVTDAKTNEKKAQIIKDAVYTFQMGESPKAVFKEDKVIALEQTTKIDTPPILENPLPNATYGGADGILQPYMSEIILRRASRKTCAKNFAQILPLKGLRGMGIYKETLVDDSVNDGSFTPVGEMEVGQEYQNTYNKFYFDAYKYMLHSGFSWELLEEAAGQIELISDVMEDLGDAHGLLVDRDYFEGQYSAITSGTFRRWEGSDWGESAEIPKGKAVVTGANAKYHKLFYDISTGKTYYPSDTLADNMKYHESVRRDTTLSPDGQDVFDVIVDAAELMVKKDRELEYVAVTPELLTRLTKDERFLDAFKLTGYFKFQGEGCFMGQVAIGGSASVVDLWLIPPKSLSAKQTDDTSPVEITDLIMGGQYKKSGIIAPYGQFGLMVDDGFTTKTVNSKTVLRRNDSKVLTTKSVQGVVPSDVEALVMIYCVKTAHA